MALEANALVVGAHRSDASREDVRRSMGRLLPGNQLRLLDPGTGEPLPEGEEGVLVFTTLTKRAMPLIRYWTGDITSLSSDPCACGRTLVRMRAIKGRADDMLIIRGVNASAASGADAQLPDRGQPHWHAGRGSGRGGGH